MAKRTIKSKLRNLGRLFGLDIRLSGLNSREDLRFHHFLRLHKIDTVIDVGANRGQFALELLNAGFRGRIISIEPLPGAHEVLQAASSKRGTNWEVVRRLALSDSDGSATFFVTKSDTASSLLEPTSALNQATPSTEVVESITVETLRLDELIKELNLGQSRILLKLDVQGGEGRVLAGAVKTIDLISGVLVELSFAKLYDDQVPPAEILNRMEESGFKVWDLWRGYSHPETYRLDQVDALFFKDC